MTANNLKIANKILWLLVAIGILIAVFFFNSWQASRVADNAIPQKVELPILEVEVFETQRQNHRLYVQSHGEVYAKDSLLLLSEVSGKVVEISDNFEAGMLVKKNEVLLTLDDTQYSLALASAQSQLAQAKVRLLEEERQAEQAESEWELSGIADAPESELVLRKPQLQAAQAAYDEAVAHVAKAQKDMDNTQVKAPFDALVIENKIVLGTILSGNTEIGKLESTDFAEVELPLSSAQWQILAKNMKDISIELVDLESSDTWQAVPIRSELHKDTNTRQRSIIARVRSPLESNLLYGTFVQARIGGLERDDLIEIPSSALFNGAFVWSVSNGILTKTEVHIVHYENDMLYIQAEDVDVNYIVIRPSNRYFEGQQITPILSKNEEIEGE